MFNFLCEVKNPIFLFWKSQLKPGNTNRSITGHIVDFKRYVIGNKFINETAREVIFLEIDILVRRAYLSYKYAKLWLIKYIHRKRPVNGFDLGLDEIDENIKNVITYVDIRARRKYLFSQKDFKKLIKSSLENSYMYDHLPQPLPLRNPYTNKEFHTTDLIDIDRILIDSPLIWKMFRDCKYNLERFKITNYTYLTICCTGSFVDQMDGSDITFYIEDIFMYYNVKNYCTKCVQDISNIRNKKLRNILINWFLFQKHLGIFTQIDLISLCEIFKLDCLVHTKKTKEYSHFRSDIMNFEFTGGPILTNYVFMGNREENKEQNKEISKPRYKGLKIKKKPKKVLKKKAVIKTII
jgi:hypothetical protein